MMAAVALSDFIAGAVLAGLITAVPSTLAWRSSKKAAVHSEAVNNAVNNRPDGEPTLYELARGNAERSDLHGRCLLGLGRWAGRIAPLDTETRDAFHELADLEQQDPPPT